MKLRGPHLTGDIRAHLARSDALRDQRQVTVYLPPGYEEHPERQYPVVYVHDGQNVFDPGRAAFGAEWGLDETAERLIREGRLRDVILVALDNGGGKRVDEYTPVPDPEHGGGGAAAHEHFLLDEVKPFIDRTYRTSRRPEDTGLLGSSLGGLVSLHLGFSHPEAFGLVGALSPSLWWAGRELNHRLEGVQGGPQRVFLGMGTAESQTDRDGNGVPDVLDATRELRDHLQAAGYREGEDLRYREVPGGRHDEASWAEQVGEALIAMLGPGGHRTGLV